MACITISHCYTAMMLYFSTVSMHDMSYHNMGGAGHSCDVGGILQLILWMFISLYTCPQAFYSFFLL